jgi:cytochrome P450 family 6
METLSCTSVLLGVMVILLGTLYVYFKNKFNYWKKRGVLYLKPSFPFGNCVDIVLMRKSFGEAYTKHYKMFTGNKCGGIYFVHRPQLLIRDPDVIKNILVKDFDHFHDHGFAFDEKIDPLSGNLFMLTGVKWKELRTKLSPTFTSGKMKMMFQTLVDCGVELREHLKKSAGQEDILELRDVLAKFSTDVIASCAFGIECNCLKNPDAEFRQWGKRIFEPTFEAILRGMLYLLIPSVAIALRISGTPNDITNFFCTMVRETVHFREKHSVKRNDFLQLLIRLKNKESLEPDTSTEQHDPCKYCVLLSRQSALS